MEQHRLVSRIVKTVGPLPGVVAIILYGSFARGDHGPKSDVDLLILVRRPSQTRVVNDCFAEREFGREIQPTIRSLQQLRKTDTGLLRNVFREGKILFLKEPLDLPAARLLDLKPFALYTFSLKGLPQPQKARFNRLLYARKTAGYQYRGLLADLGGIRLSSGCFLLPRDSCRRIERAFKQHRVNFQSRKVWI